ncbi:MAG: diaminopimelate epimerase [Chromatiales bacterium]|nr:diaminopimelate epimerase [Chromatiales bacterium]MDH3893595.1 diaminopimelate epimerase [Chromatiales bacterium]MDH4013072.1 diaminopimelate epimerase [Chromatiales bacterium]PLX55400.1 MAG: diaminopimelate epimerase [Chromatiales bacterium]
MILKFVKMHGLGNDFAVFDCRDDAPTPDTGLLRRLADRRTGIGFDQALMLAAARDAASAASYRIVNADGSEVEQCGNGARCLALLLALRREALPCELTLDSPTGTIRARVTSADNVAVEMGEPDFRPQALPFVAPADGPPYTLDINTVPTRFRVVSMGNPHAVIDVEDVDSVDVAGIGAALCEHPAFPMRCNVGFMQRVSEKRIRLRVFERGAGETRACGTGACAAVAAGRFAGLLEPEVDVCLPGGELHVSWPGPGEPLWMSGAAAIAFEGTLNL